MHQGDRLKCLHTSSNQEMSLPGYCLPLKSMICNADRVMLPTKLPSRHQLPSKEYCWVEQIERLGNKLPLDLRISPSSSWQASTDSCTLRHTVKS